VKAIVPLNFENYPIRIIPDDTGEPWFVAPDVCRVLDIGNSRQVLTRLDDDEKGFIIADTLGGAQEMAVINKGGLYSLILTSRKEAAKRFKKWVTSEVLPTIRKTGRYGAPAAGPMVVLNDPAAMRGLLLTYSEKVIALQTENAVLTPKGAVLDRIGAAGGSICALPMRQRR
jgi:anti-repressor protein